MTPGAFPVPLPGRAMPDDPSAWFQDVVRAHADASGTVDPDSPRWVDLETLLGEGPLSLPALHRHIVDHDHTPPATAATYLAGWFAGSTAEIVGLALATAHAGFLVDPARLRWHLHADGWPERVELGDVDVLVPPGHPWLDRRGVVAVDALAAVVDQAVERLVSAVRPLIDRCHGLARVGRTGLWNEVGDGLVMVLRHFDELEVDEAMLATVTGAARLGGVPWRAHAELRIVETPWGRACVGRKGGCCMAYKCPGVGQADDRTDEDTDEETLEFRRRFPARAGEPRYCTTCSFRKREDAEARQLYWFELARRRAASLTDLVMAGGGVQPSSPAEPHPSVDTTQEAP